jgi:hypothetical protein
MSPVDIFKSLSGGRAHFRVEDLIEMVTRVKELNLK